MFLIILLGLLLRLSFIDKPQGMWNDEYVSWFVSNTPFFDGFWKQVTNQCHMPLYYFYLKPFSSCSDLILRLTSTVPSIISIFVMYYVGKEFSKKVGKYALIVTSVLSFLVYYSQEVRFYSVLFLFSALSLLFTIRLLKQENKFNLILYTVSNLLVVFTHVLGIAYVILNLIYVVSNKKEVSKKVYYLLAFSIPVSLYFGLNIIKMIPQSQWWGHFSYTNILFLITDYFSPILSNHINAPARFFYNAKTAYLMIIPSLIACYSMYHGLRQKFLRKEMLGLFVVNLLFIIMLIFLALLGKIVFITKYSIEILPSLILFVSLGFDKLNKIGVILLSIFVSFHIGTFFTPYYVTKTIQKEGHRIPAEIIKEHNANNILFTYYAPDRFTRYINLAGKNVYYISKINRFEYMDNPQKILDKVKLGDSVTVVFLDSVSFLSDEILENNKDNTMLPEMFKTFSHIKNSIVNHLSENYTDYKVTKKGSWVVITAKKLK